MAISEKTSYGSSIPSTAAGLASPYHYHDGTWPSAPGAFQQPQVGILQKLYLAVGEAVERAGGLLPRLFGRKLVLALPGGEVSFQSLSDFEFCLEGKTDVPVARIPELMALAPADLRQAATDIRRVEQRLTDVLAGSLDNGDAAQPGLDALGTRLFSQDHGWRDIITALRQHGSAWEEYKHLALAKYLQYLGARREVLRNLYAQKKPAPPARRVERPNAEAPAKPAERDPKDTAIFDLGELSGAALEVDSTYTRLPRGQGVVVRLDDGQTMELLLARLRLKLQPGNPVQLADGRGRTWNLWPGRNVVGRFQDNDVVIDPRCRAVSRKHVIIEPLGASAFRLTDLSAHGTFVPSQVTNGSSGQDRAAR